MTATIWTPTHESAAQARAQARGVAPDQPAGPPLGTARMPNFPVAKDAQGHLQLRGQQVDWQGKPRYQLDGYATIWGRKYEMWDVFGPYREHVNPAAAETTLARDDLDVAFLLNHRGLTMARTVGSGQPSLTLEADGMGMHSRAFVNPERQDVRDMILAIEDQDITEMSFAFLINEGEWNEEFTEYEIKAFDLHRGDVSAVNYGANPYTSIGVRAQEFMHDLDKLPAGVARGAVGRLLGRADVDLPTRPVPDQPARVGGYESGTTRASDMTPPSTGIKPAPTGRSVAMLEAELRLEDDD